jgi:hypothetical protein
MNAPITFAQFQARCHRVIHDYAPALGDTAIYQTLGFLKLSQPRRAVGS